jgi:hypothetical protein
MTGEPEVAARAILPRAAKSLGFERETYHRGKKNITGCGNLRSDYATEFIVARTRE